MLGDQKPKDGEWNRVGMSTISKWVKASRHELLFEVAERSLESRLAAVARYLPLAAQQAEEDVEHVHQLRVWSRRATATLRLYREVIPWSRSERPSQISVESAAGRRCPRLGCASVAIADRRGGPRGGADTGTRACSGGRPSSRCSRFSTASTMARSSNAG